MRRGFQGTMCFGRGVWLDSDKGEVRFKVKISFSWLGSGMR